MPELQLKTAGNVRETDVAISLAYSENGTSQTNHTRLALRLAPSNSSDRKASDLQNSHSLTVRKIWIF
jgi:hypothetical protein